jgi:hypothetical protein
MTKRNLILLIFPFNITEVLVSKSGIGQKSVERNTRRMSNISLDVVRDVCQMQQAQRGNRVWRLSMLVQGDKAKHQ